MFDITAVRAPDADGEYSKGRNPRVPVLFVLRCCL
jgi:hypothetical protein